MTGVVLQLPPQVVDVDPKLLRVFGRVTSPNALQQLAVGEDLSRLACQYAQQVEFRRREVDLTSGTKYEVAPRVDRTAPGEDALLSPTASPPQRHPQSRKQFRHSKRFREIVVRALIKRHNFVGIFAARREHDN